MELKIHCACGQKIAFDIEPVDGRVPVQLQCPGCGASINALADAQIAERTAAAPAPASGGGLKLRVAARPEPSHAPAAEAESKPAVPLPAMARVPVSHVGNVEADKPRYLWSTIGAVTAGLVGMLGWYLLIRMTKIEFGIVAWGVGLVTGFGAKVATRYSTPLIGLIAAGCAFVAILGGQFLAGRTIAIEEIGKLENGMLSMTEKLATEVHADRAKMSDEQLRKDIAFRKSDFSRQITVKPEEITADDIKKYRAMSIEDIRAEMQAQAAEVRGNITSSWSFHWEVFKAGLSIFTLLWLFLGVGSAYRLAAADTSDSLG